MLLTPPATLEARTVIITKLKIGNWTGYEKKQAGKLLQEKNLHILLRNLDLGRCYAILLQDIL